MVQCYKLGLKALESGSVDDMKKAKAVQEIVTQADWIIIKAVRAVVFSCLIYAYS